MKADNLRKRAEELQDSIWRQHLVAGPGLCILTLELPAFVYFYGYWGLLIAIGTAWQWVTWRRQGWGMAIPRSLSSTDLAGAHRQELKRHLGNLGLFLWPVSAQLLWVIWRDMTPWNQMFAPGPRLGGSSADQFWAVFLHRVVPSFAMGLNWLICNWMIVRRGDIQLQLDELDHAAARDFVE